MISTQGYVRVGKVSRHAQFKTSNRTHTHTPCKANTEYSIEQDTRVDTDR